MRWRVRHEPERPIEGNRLGPLVDGDTVLPSGELRRGIDRDLLCPPDAHAPDEEPTADTDRGRP